jgi:sugar lactone lactonase YvrE
MELSCRFPRCFQAEMAEARLLRVSGPEVENLPQQEQISLEWTMNNRSKAGRDAASSSRRIPSAFAVCGLLLGLAAAGSGSQAQTTPAAIVLKSTMLLNINGNAGHVAANSAGDAFYVSQTDNVAYWLKRGTTTPIPLVTGLSGGRSVYVDASNNVYVPSNYSGVIIEVPYVNGTYTTNSARASLSACTSATPTAPCTQFGNGGAGVSYYYQATDLAFDGSGNAYIADGYNNEGPAGVNTSNAIEIFSYNGVSYSAKILINNLPHTTNAQIAVDKKGDVYYADGTNLYTVPAGASTISTFGTGLKAPVGVSLDQYGNLFVTDSTLDQIIEFPAVNGVAQTIRQFVFDPIYSANGVGFDGLGDMYYTGYSGGTTNLNVARINSFSLGSAVPGSAVSATATTLTLSFVAAETLGTPVLSGAAAGFSYTAGTCAAATAYTAQQTCNFNVNYTPTAVGLQTGAVVFTNSSGATIATAELSGIGLGAAQTTDPGTTSAIGSGYSSPQGIAVDGSKNVYVADAGKNAVYEYAAGSGTAVSLGTGLSKPSSVAVDNAGNVYIGDAGNGRVVEIPSVAGALTSSAQSVVISGLGSTIGLATDAYGDLFVADTANNKVMELGPINGAPNSSASSSIALQSSSAAPFALATDSTGDLFVGDITANTVTEVGYYGKGITNIGAGYSHPSGLAVDASGSLYVADPGNLRLIKIPFESPIYNPNDEYSVGPPFTVAAGITIPYGVAVDSSANLYVVDNQDATVTLLNRQQGTLNLGASNVGSTTAQQSSYIGSAGNQSLILLNPAYTTTPNSAFAITSPSSDGCTNNDTLPAGFSCVLQATFTPPATGSYKQVLAFNSNAANTTTPQLNVIGTGLTVAATTLTLAQTSPAGSAAFGQTVVISATITSSTAGTPSGDVIFYVDGNFYSVVKVTGSTQSLNITGLLGGVHTIAASYTGDNNYASSNSTLSITVVKASSSVTVAGTGGGVSQFPTSATAGTTIVLTATVVPNAKTVPTGTVTFTLGSKTLGTASVVTSGTTYVASISTAAFTSGNNTVVATYSGDVNYASSSGTLVVLISPQTFTITPSTQTATVSAAGSVTIPFQSASISGFGNAYVSLTCSGLPANTSCGFQPNGYPLQPGNLLTAQQTNPAGTIVLVPATYGPVNLSLTIQTGTTPIVVPPTINASLRRLGMAGGAPISLALLAFMPMTLLLRRRLTQRLRGPARLLSMLLVLSASMLALSGCGSNLVGITPKGTYMVTITATATDPSYPAVTATSPLAPGCVITPSAATYPTCTQVAQVSLVVQ